MARKEFTGTVNVFREGSAEHLEAIVKTECGEEFYYWKAPLCFCEPTYWPNTFSNLYKATFTANEDGKNPRSVNVIEDYPC